MGCFLSGGIYLFNLLTLKTLRRRESENKSLR